MLIEYIFPICQRKFVKNLNKSFYTFQFMTIERAISFREKHTFNRYRPMIKFDMNIT